MRPIVYIAALSAALASITAHAETFSTYDDFSALAIDPARWFDGERLREIRNGALNLKQRSFGAGGSDSGQTAVNWNESLVNPQAVTWLRARVKVQAYEVNSCAANTTAAQSRARVLGSFFNVGTPTPGSQVGDVIAQIRVTRFSNSADPAGVLRVQGLVSLCTAADCSTSSLIGNVVELGTVTLNQWATVQVKWSKGGNAFLFARDGADYSGSVGYAESDANPPGVAFKQVSTRLDLPNCASAPRVVNSVNAWFDNISVNSSALP
jgi:hypothetical protein